MATTVRLSIFSGRPNPRFRLPAKAEKELRDRITRLKGGDKRRVTDVRPEGLLIFRVTRDNERGRSEFLCGGGLIEFPLYPFSYPDAEGIEHFLLDLCPDRLLAPSLKRELTGHFRYSPKSDGPEPRTKADTLLCYANSAADTQTFDDNWGTSGYNHQPCNNCYDYANQQVTDTFSQPGLGGGRVFTEYECQQATAGSESRVIGATRPANTVGAGATRDGLVSVPNCTDPLGPGEGWYVALLIGTLLGEPDFHWLKQDNSGCWSQKLGGGAVLWRDSNLRRIQNPETAVFNYAGGLQHYGTFCGYFLTSPAVKIRGVDPTTDCYASWY